jgi:stage V sporulation protein S
MHTREEIILETLKVSSTSDPKSVAGAIAAISRNNQQVDIVAIGASAVNQAVKSVIISRGYVAPNGIDLICIPAFGQLEVDGEKRTSVHFLVERR